MKTFKVKSWVGGMLMTGLMFTSCGNKDEKTDETGAYENEVTAPDDNVRVETPDTSRMLYPDTTYESTSDTMNSMR